jgi:hypothetical protein
VPALERVTALRVVAEPAALDGARWQGPTDGEVTLLRVAPDEVIAVAASEVQLDDASAIVVEETGLVVARCRVAEIEHRMEWPLPTDRPAQAQGAVAGVPAKLVLRSDGTVDLYTPAAYAHDLAARLGWSVPTDVGDDR